MSREKLVSAAALLSILNMVAIAQTTVNTNGGTSNTVPLFTAPSAIGNSVLSQNGANIGVGVNVPWGIFTIASPAQDGQGNAQQGLVFADTLFGSDQSWAQAAIYGVGTAGYNGNLVFATDGDSAEDFNLTERMRIDEKGNVGIGTSIPGVVLDVNAGNATSAQLRVSSTGGDAAVSFNNTASGGREYWWDSGSGGAGVGAGNFSIWDKTAGATRLAVTPAGNIGIGTTAPQARLEVNGSMKLTTGSGGGITFADGTVQTSASQNAAAQTSAGGTAIGSNLIINNTLLQNPQSQATTPYNYKLATLTASSVATLDHLHLLIDLNAGWGSTGHRYLDAVFANRNGFTYQYTARGAAISGDVKLTAYANSDSSVDIYLTFSGTAYATASYTIVENNQETVYPSPTTAGATPPGTLVFDSSSPTYPAASFLDYAGNLNLNGGLKLLPGGGAPITFGDGTVQSTAWSGVLCGGDYAESIDVSGDRAAYEPGDVLVIDPDNEGRFLKSSVAYSTAVTGIYSTQPGLVGRRQSSDRRHMKDEVPMAMVGIVPTKVSAENGPIRPGDLLVTSSTAGYAMKATDRSQMLGAVIGKSLGHLDSGTGLVEVVVTLQ